MYLHQGLRMYGYCKPCNTQNTLIMTFVLHFSLIELNLSLRTSCYYRVFTRSQEHYKSYEFYICITDTFTLPFSFNTKALAKLGNIVAETLFLVMFSGVAKLGNICCGSKICVREAKMFLT